MRLKSFQIKNFKSIVDTGKCYLSDTDNLLVLAGQNEVGKSAIIEALDFFGNGPDEDFERLQRRQDTTPEVVWQVPHILDTSRTSAIMQSIWGTCQGCIKST